MKRIIFILMAFSMTLSVAMANDVGKRSNDFSKNSHAVQQISFVTPILNVVNFEMTQAVYQTNVLFLSVINPPLTTQLNPEAFAQLDPGLCIQVSVNKFTLTNLNSDFRIKYKIQNRIITSSFLHNMQSTTRHV